MPRGILLYIFNVEVLASYSDPSSSGKTSDLTPKWEIELAEIIKNKGKFKNTIKSRKVKKIQVIIQNKEQVYLSLGEHNDLQKRIIDDMLPSFCYEDTEVLYLGDTNNHC